MAQGTFCTLEIESSVLYILNRQAFKHNDNWTHIRKRKFVYTIWREHARHIPDKSETKIEIPSVVLKLVFYQFRSAFWMVKRYHTYEHTVYTQSYFFGMLRQHIRWVYLICIPMVRAESLKWCWSLPKVWLLGIYSTWPSEHEIVAISGQWLDFTGC